MSRTLMIWGGPLDGAIVTGGTLNGVPYRDLHTEEYGGVRLIEHAQILQTQCVDIKGPNITNKQLVRYYDLILELPDVGSNTRAWIKNWMTKHTPFKDREDDG